MLLTSDRRRDAIPLGVCEFGKLRCGSVLPVFHRPLRSKNGRGRARSAQARALGAKCLQRIAQTFEIDNARSGALMTHDAQGYISTERAIRALEQTITLLRRRVQEPYHFRFVNQAQPKPVAAFFLWDRNGRVGPQPSFSLAEFRAAIYDQACAASKLAAFPKVASVSAVGLADTAVERLKAGDISITYTALRGFIERTAHAVALARSVKTLVGPQPTQT